MERQTIHLVQIGLDGEPAEAGLALPNAAKEVCATTASLYRSVGFEPPWTGYFVLSQGVVTGTCAFTSPPRHGRVEIAYFTFPEFEGRGLPTSMARALIGIARAAQPQIKITAQTLPTPNASNTILQKLGFRYSGTIDHPEDGKVWEWHLPAC